MIELLSPAGTPEALKAAVAAGADAVYFGANNFNARINANNFGKEEILAAIDYCHRQGVHCHATMNTLLSDREMPEALSLAEFFVSAGIDAFIVQDIGFAGLLLKATDTPLHASTQMTVHSLDGVLQLAEMGFKRAVLSRELSAEDIRIIKQGTPKGFELEIFVHGALCMSYSGQCYMSSIIGNRSGNRGQCAQPCRLPYDKGYRLSLKDLCLIKKLNEIRDIGIDSLKIEGRMKSPEYVYTITKKYADALQGKNIIQDDITEMEDVFSRGGFTDGYFSDKHGQDMFGTKTATPGRNIITVPTNKYKRYKIDLSGYTLQDTNDNNILNITYTTEDCLSACTEIKLEKPKTKILTADDIISSLTKYGDTIYYEGKSNISLSGDFFVSNSVLNAARRECLGSIEEMRTIKNHAYRKPTTELASHGKSISEQKFSGYFLNPDNIPDNARLLDAIIIPAEKITGKKLDILRNRFNEKICLSLPPIFHDTEKHIIDKIVRDAYTEHDIRHFAVNNIGQLKYLSELKKLTFNNMVIHGDYGLNIFNSYSKSEYKKIGVASEILTFEAPYAMLTPLFDEETGIIAYGRLPFMVMRNCIKKQHRIPEYMEDRLGKKFLLSCEFGCRNRMFNSDVLWLADKNISGAGFIRLMFTDESIKKIADIIDSYINKNDSGRPNTITRGNYKL